MLSRHPTGEELDEDAESVDRMLWPTFATTHDHQKRVPEPASQPTILEAIEVITLADEVKAAQHRDPEFATMMERLETIAEEGPQVTGDVAFRQNYEKRDGYLWRRGDPPQLWVPPAIRPRILYEFHDSTDAGHPGQEETARAIKQQYAHTHTYNFGRTESGSSHRDKRRSRLSRRTQYNKLELRINDA